MIQKISLVAVIVLTLVVFGVSLYDFAQTQRIQEIYALDELGKKADSVREGHQIEISAATERR